MDPFLDDFITYENQFENKHQGLLDHDFPLSSPFSENSDSTGVFPAFLPKTIQNFLDPDDSQFPQAQIQSKDSPQPAASPYYTMLSKKEDYTDPSEVTESIDQFEFFNNSEDNEETGSKLNSRSKRIQKREKAKERVNTKKTKNTTSKPAAKPKEIKEDLSNEDFLQQVDVRFIPEGFDDPDLDDKTRKKMIQMIRNRVSAQNSRDRKKVYLQQLEENNTLLNEENSRLEKEKAALLQQLQEAEATCRKFQKENEELKRNNLCLKCGCTLDDSSSATEESMPSIFPRRTHAGGSFFGLGMSFAFIFCILLFLNGDYFNGSALMAQGGQAARATTMNALANIVNKIETCAIPLADIQSGPLPTKEIKASLAEMQLQLGGAPILEKIKPRMDQFNKHHENVYRAYENNKVVVDLSEKMLENRTYALSNMASYDHHSRSFLEEERPSVITTKNKTSTLFCPNGFEFFVQKERVAMEEEKSAFFNGVESLSVGKTLDLEKADYVQLLLPKNMIGRYGVTENSSETGIPIIPDVEDKTLIEVWAKIYAVRDLALSL